MKRALSYLRTSSLTNTGSDKDSQSRQEEVIAEYAGLYGYDVLETGYDEGRSGADPISDRDGFKDVLEYCQEHSITTILLESSSRYARDKDVAVKGFYLLESYGIDSLIDCNANIDLLGLWFSEKPFEALLPFLKMIISAEEKKDVVRRLKSGRDKKKALTGKCSGRKSLTEKYGTDFKITAVRARSRGRSYQEIANLFTKRGILTANGNPYTRGTVWNLVNLKTLK
jgi:DNA invertase Pin-like site-specific DNA recombinase|tara:strand:- start:32 stop:712 length:681 start_codon:yes stop_codon:yes gene_type:complete